MTFSVSAYGRQEITRKLGQKFPICLSGCNVFVNVLFKFMFTDENRAWVNVLLIRFNKSHVPYVNVLHLF